MEEKTKIKQKQMVLMFIGIAILVVSITGITFAFFNYTKTGGANVIKTGNIEFNMTQGKTINLQNVFPVTSTEALADNSNTSVCEIVITGRNTYAGGVEYLVSTVNATNTDVPVSILVNVEGNGNGANDNLGISDNDYFTNRNGYTTSHYKKLVGDSFTGNEDILVGYIASSASTDNSINGKITIRAYFDKNNIIITDTPDETNTGDKTVMSTSEWNALNSTGISFQVKVEANEGKWVEQKPMPASCFTYTEANNEITITGYDNTCGLDVMIPDTINGKNVTKIGGLYNKGITSIVLPQYLSVINDGAFYGNQLSGQFVIPNSIISIGANSFANNQITNLTIPNNVTSISSAGPFGNNPITTLNIDVSIIPSACFSSLSIQNLTLGEHVSTIGDGAFSNNQITNLTIPNNVTSISSAGPFGNNPITTLFIDMETIPSNAFNPDLLGGQGQISSLTIGTNVKTINSNAFTKNRITSVTIPSNVETMKCNAFDAQKDSNNNSITTNITYEQSEFTCTN